MFLTPTKAVTFIDAKPTSKSHLQMFVTAHMYGAPRPPEQPATHGLSKKRWKRERGKSFLSSKVSFPYPQLNQSDWTAGAKWLTGQLPLAASPVDPETSPNTISLFCYIRRSQEGFSTKAKLPGGLMVEQSCWWKLSYFVWAHVFSFHAFFIKTYPWPRLFPANPCAIFERFSFFR